MGELGLPKVVQQTGSLHARGGEKKATFHLSTMKKLINGVCDMGYLERSKNVWF